LYVVRRYFVVDKIKRLLDKLVELLQFYVGIVNFIRNQVCSVHSLPLKMHIFAIWI
jgi:hypothetical protein